MVGDAIRSICHYCIFSTIVPDALEEIDYTESQASKQAARKQEDR